MPECTPFANDLTILPFSIVRTSGFPFELIEQLQFNDTYNVITASLLCANGEKRALKNDAIAGDIRTSFSLELRKKQKTLWDIVKNERFREGLLILSPTFFNTIEQYLTKTDVLTKDRSYKIRRQEQALISFMQRFCVKNDTTSFVGPFFWSTIERSIDSNVKVSFDEGEGKKMISYEYWAAKRMAAKINSDEEIVKYIAPRCSPDYRINIQNRAVHGPHKELKDITAQDFEILVHCNGKDRISDIVQHIDRGVLVRSQADDRAYSSVYQILKKLQDKGVIFWRVIIPNGIFHPFEYLIEALQAIPDTCQTKQKWLEILRHFRSLKNTFLNASMNEKKKYMYEMNELFEKVTGEDSYRFAGKTYASRMLTFDDVARNVKCQIHERVINDYLRDFHPVLLWARNVIRYFVATVERKTMDCFQEELAQSEKIPLMRFLEKKLSIAYKYAPDFVNYLKALVEQSPPYLDNDEHSGVLKISGQRLTDLAQSLVSDPIEDCVWLDPDIMIVANSVDDINRGAYKILINEMHAGASLFYGFFTFACEGIDQLQKSFLDTMKEKNHGKLLAFLRKENANKFYTYSLVEGVYEIEYEENISRRTDEFVLPISDLYVELGDGKLSYKSYSLNCEIAVYDHKFVWNAVSYITEAALQVICCSGGRRVSSRVEIGNVILKRKRWEIQIDEEIIKRLASKRNEELFIEMLQFQNKHGLPLSIFVKVPGESKPFFIDFRNYFLLELFKKLISRKCQTLTITEMLPAPEQLWFKDKSGRYTSEIRMSLTYK